MSRQEQGQLRQGQILIDSWEFSESPVILEVIRPVLFHLSPSEWKLTRAELVWSMRNGSLMSYMTTTARALAPLDFTLSSAVLETDSTYSVVDGNICILKFHCVSTK